MSNPVNIIPKYTVFIALLGHMGWLGMCC